MRPRSETGRLLLRLPIVGPQQQISDKWLGILRVIPFDAQRMAAQQRIGQIQGSDDNVSASEGNDSWRGDRGPRNARDHFRKPLRTGSVSIHQRMV